MAKPIHSMIRVLDEDRSVSFYRTALALEVAERFAFDGFTLVYLRSPESEFELELTINIGHAEPYQLGDGYGHIAVSVPDIETEHARMSSAGLQPTAVKEMTHEGRRLAKFFFLQDPDGYRIEVLQRQGRYLWGSPRLSRATCITSGRQTGTEPEQTKCGGTKMRQIERRSVVGRRLVLRGAATAVPAATLVAGGVGISAKAVWAQEAQTLKPHTMATLVLMARDIYPHDQIADIFYVKAVQPYDDKASSDAVLRDLLEQGVAGLDSASRTNFKQPYLDVPEERDRLIVLNDLATTPFFGKVRSGLVVGLYNQPELWRRFGYEGSSAEYGGYLNRGFDDIDWLPKA